MKALSLTINRLVYPNPYENTLKAFSFFRLAIGFIVVFHYLAIIQDYKQLYSTSGLIDKELIALKSHGNYYLSTFYWAKVTGLTTQQLASLCMGGILLFGSFLSAGLFTRLSALLVLILHHLLHNNGPIYMYGVDLFTRMSLTYLVLFPSNHYFSLDKLFMKLKAPKNYDLLIFAFQIHVCIVYFFTGLDKSFGFNWWNGESFWKAIHMYDNSSVVTWFNWMHRYPVIPLILGWGAFLIELLYPLCIWMPRTRKIWLVSVIGLHLMIAIILKLYFFSAVMIVWNLTAFYFPFVKEKALRHA
jgi:hypothetical protein